MDTFFEECGALWACRGHRKFCLLFSILHLIIGVWNTLAAHPTVWLASICLSLASSIFSFSFETWMVVEHDKVCFSWCIFLFVNCSPSGYKVISVTNPLSYWVACFVLRYFNYFISIFCNVSHSFCFLMKTHLLFLKFSVYLSLI